MLIKSPASSLPIRGTHQGQIKATRQEASTHYSPSVDSTQAPSSARWEWNLNGGGALKKDDWRWSWKKSAPTERWSRLGREDNLPALKKACVFCVDSLRTVPSNHSNRSWHNWGCACPRALDYHLWFIISDNCSIWNVIKAKRNAKRLGRWPGQYSVVDDHSLFQAKAFIWHAYIFHHYSTFDLTDVLGDISTQKVWWVTDKLWHDAVCWCCVKMLKQCPLLPPQGPPGAAGAEGRQGEKGAKVRKSIHPSYSRAISASPFAPTVSPLFPVLN